MNPSDITIAAGNGLGWGGSLKCASRGTEDTLLPQGPLHPMTAQDFVLYHTLLAMLGNTYVGFRNELGSSSLLLSPPLLPLLSLEGFGGGNPPQS